jgi:Protein of unknown function (DUF3501).
MDPLSIDDLYKLEEYAERRQVFRQQVIAHKRDRKLHVGDHLTLLFEDRLTVLYQVQEMLRIERIFERAGIQDELDAYNPLIPDGRNWKATLLIEYPDIAERDRKLVELRGIEAHLWAQVGDQRLAPPVADEDLDRQNDTKTAAVHFLRFELDAAQVRALREGAELRFGADHPAYQADVLASGELRAALLRDLD